MGGIFSDPAGAGVDPRETIEVTTALPRGSVTFVFTDIEGSTRLLRHLGEAYPAVLEQHRAILRTMWKAHRGIEIKVVGDACFAAFASSTDALAGCAGAQQALAAGPWPTAAAAPKVRMGVHTGIAFPHDGDYIALAVHQAARIAAGAHGGQVLMSDATATAAGPRLPEGATLTPLGSFQLRGFPAPERLFQLVHPDLAGTFPPPRALGVVSHNLPFLRASFVGRETERAALADLVPATGVLTIVGPGGVGGPRRHRDQGGGRRLLRGVLVSH